MCVNWDVTRSEQFWDPFFLHSGLCVDVGVHVPVLCKTYICPGINTVEAVFRKLGIKPGNTVQCGTSRVGCG